MGKAETHFNKPHSQHNDIQLRGNSQLPPSPLGVSGLHPNAVPQLLRLPDGKVGLLSVLHIFQD